MMRDGKIPVELTPEQMADMIDAATRAAEQDQEDAEILSSQPHIDREIVELVLETRKRLLTLAAWMQHLWESVPQSEHYGTRGRRAGRDLYGGQALGLQMERAGVPPERQGGEAPL